jgi:glutathione S-transferase
MTAGRYRLINARPSPYGRKVAIALLAKGLVFDVTYDEPWSDHSTTGDYSPLQQLPILITPDGHAVYDSSHILDWLEIKHPEPNLLPELQADRLAALNMKALGERLMEIAQSLIFEMHRQQPAAAWIDRQTTKIASGLGELDRLCALPFASNTVQPAYWSGNSWSKTVSARQFPYCAGATFTRR